MRTLFFIDFFTVHYTLEKPTTIRELFQRLGFKPDNTGLASFKDDSIKPSSSERGFFVFRIGTVDAENFTVRDLCSKLQKKNPADKAQVAEFLVTYLENLDITAYFLVPFSLWIPFIDEKGDGSFRVFARSDGSVELFLYPAEDRSTWAIEYTYVAYLND